MAGNWPSPALLFGMVLLAGPASAQIVAPSVDDLIAKATREGSVRVNVELEDRPGAEVRQSIAALQDVILQELAGTRYRVLRQFTTSPFLGLEVSYALRRMGASPRVAGIREERLVQPQ